MYLASPKNKFLAGLILGIYLLVSLYSLVSLAGHVTMHTHHSPCPYMPGGSGLCTMNIFDHITQWHQFSEIVFTLFKVLVPAVFIFASFLVLEIFQRLKLYSPPLSQSLYESLFSDGILNSKAP